MFSRLTRILLALVTAFVFTGQMEAAARHCAKLAEQAAHAEPAADAAPACHDANGTMASMTDPVAMTHHPAHSQKIERCECIAALTGCIDLAPTTASQRAEPYAWLLPETATFASSEPDPDLRPPRA